MGWGLPGILRYLPNPSIVPRPLLPRILSALPAEARVCDVGAGGRRIIPSVIAVDALPGPGVDIVGDIHDLPIPDESMDCVLCTGTFEHIRAPWIAVQELRRITKPGGIVYIDVPFIQGYHRDPVDYWRFTLDGLKLLCQDFEEIESGTHIGPTCGLIWIIREWVNSLTSHRIISNLLLVPVALLTAPFRYLDFMLIRGKRSHHVASAVYFLGRKPLPQSPR